MSGTGYAKEVAQVAYACSQLLSSRGSVNRWNPNKVKALEQYAPEWISGGLHV